MSTHQAHSMLGKTLGKTYRVERLIGVGATGAVYAARHVRTGGPCAIKVLHRRLRVAPEAFGRFVEESAAVQALRHPHIVPFTDIDRDESGATYLVEELLVGENLQQRLKGGCLTLSQAVEIARQVGGALQAAHKGGVVHRNLRPENIFLVRQDLGEGVVESVRVTDFGLARLRRGGPAPPPPPGSVASVPPGFSQYTAPECLRPGGVVDARADQWALAVVLYRMLSGRLPFEGENLRDVLRQMLREEGEEPTPLTQLAPELPPQVAEAIHRGLARSPGARFDSVMALVRALAPSGALVSDPSVTISLVGEVLPPPQPAPLLLAAPPAPVRVTDPAPGRSWRYAGAAAVLLLCGVASMVWLRHAPRPGLVGQAVVRPRPVPVAAPEVPRRPVVQVRSEARDLPPPGRVEPLQPAPPVAARPSVQPVAAGAAAGVPTRLRRAVQAPGEAQSPPAPAAVPEEKVELAPAAADRLMAEAQDAFAAGERQRAVALARQVAEHGGPRAAGAWRFLGTSACLLRDLRLAGRAYRRLGSEDRQFMTGVCERQGLTYLDGEFRPVVSPAGP